MFDVRYQRQVIFSSIVTSPSTQDVTWIFTEWQSTDAEGSSAAREYLAAAQSRDSPFVSVILSCSEEENIRRMTSGDRGKANTKLTDIGILKLIRASVGAFHFGAEAHLELEVDVSTMSVQDAAGNISQAVELFLAGLVLYIYD